MADEPIQPSKEDLALSAVDQALLPALKGLDANTGPVHSSTLKHALLCVRQALAHAIYGAPEPAETTGESLDVLGDTRRLAAAQRAENEQAAAEKRDPKTLTMDDLRTAADVDEDPDETPEPAPMTTAEKKAAAKLFA